MSRAAAAEGRKIVRWYEDRGVSAWNPRKVRPGYRRWLSEACSGDPVARNIWSLHLDRMYRQPRELEEFLEAAREHGIRGRTAESSSFDPENTDMVLQARILVAFARRRSLTTSRAGSHAATHSYGPRASLTGRTVRSGSSGRAWRTTRPSRKAGTPRCRGCSTRPRPQ
ncbi:MAG: recombinase family protein [Acidimicrobiales bacterium]